MNAEARAVAQAHAIIGVLLLGMAALAWWFWGWAAGFGGAVGAMTSTGWAMYRDTSQTPAAVFRRHKRTAAVIRRRFADLPGSAEHMHCLQTVIAEAVSSRFPRQHRRAALDVLMRSVQAKLAEEAPAVAASEPGAAHDPACT